MSGSLQEDEKSRKKDGKNENAERDAQSAPGRHRRVIGNCSQEEKDTTKYMIKALIRLN